MMVRHSQVVGVPHHVLANVKQDSPTRIPASMVHLQHNRTGAVASLQSKSAITSNSEQDKKVMSSAFGGKFSPG